jgi:hypothetical protein
MAAGRASLIGSRGRISQRSSPGGDVGLDEGARLGPPRASPKRRVSDTHPGSFVHFVRISHLRFQIFRISHLRFQISNQQIGAQNPWDPYEAGASSCPHPILSIPAWPSEGRGQQYFEETTRGAPLSRDE